MTKKRTRKQVDKTAIQFLHEPHRLTARLPQEHSLSCESLDFLVRGADQFLKTLKIISHDLRQQKRGAQLVYSLDFSEVFTYLWPEKARSGTAHVSRQLFEADNLLFTMPPGTLVELANNLRRIVHHNAGASHRLRELLARPIVQAFFDAGIEDRTLGSLLPSDKELIGALHSLYGLETPLDRLERLRLSPNIKDFTSLLDNSDADVLPAQDVYRQCLHSLALRRPATRPMNNCIDAHNYSLCWALSKRHQHRKSPRIYHLITSSPVPLFVFKQILWGGFPDTERDPNKPMWSLARHPVQVQYLSRVLKNQNGEEELRMLEGNLTHILRSWTRISTYEKYLNRQCGPTKTVRLPQNKEYIRNFFLFKERYENLFGVVRDAMALDFVAEENVRSLGGVGPYQVGTRASGDPADQGRVYSSKVILRLLEQVTQTALRSIESAAAVLKSLPEGLVAEFDLEGIVQKPKRLRIERKSVVDFGSEEVVVSRGSQMVFSGDLYDDYVALWWDTKATFVEFLAEAGYFLSHTSSLPERTNNSHNQKAFDGMYVYAGDHTRPIEYSLDRFPDLNADEILDALSNDTTGTVRMVRIGTSIGDLCYDFASQTSLAQRAGLVTHVRNLVEPVAEYIHRTTLRRAGLSQLRQAVKDILASTPSKAS